MTIVLVEPLRPPVVREIADSLAALQKAVGGLIQAVYPFEDDPELLLLCHEEGKLLGLPLNRALRDEDGRIYDVIAGTFFLCAAPADSESFQSLSPEQIRFRLDRFRHPEVFLPG